MRPAGEADLDVKCQGQVSRRAHLAGSIDDWAERALDHGQRSIFRRFRLSRGFQRRCGATTKDPKDTKE
jgi:hypothetical protein